MSKRKSVIQQVIVLLAVFATFCSWPVVSGSLKGPAEKLLEERLQTDSLFETAESTPPTLTTSKPSTFNADMKGITSKVPPLPDCGSGWYQQLGLQFLEALQATYVGFSFNPACEAHDACYRDVKCRRDKPECDRKLLADAEGICETAWNRAICLLTPGFSFRLCLNLVIRLLRRHERIVQLLRMLL